VLWQVLSPPPSISSAASCPALFGKTSQALSVCPTSRPFVIGVRHSGPSDSTFFVPAALYVFGFTSGFIEQAFFSAPERLARKHLHKKSESNRRTPALMLIFLSRSADFILGDESGGASRSSNSLWRTVRAPGDAEIGITYFSLHAYAPHV